MKHLIKKRFAVEFVSERKLLLKIFFFFLGGETKRNGGNSENCDCQITDIVKKELKMKLEATNR